MGRRKKKKDDNTSLYVGLGVGAAVLVLLLIGGVVAIIVSSRAAEPVAKLPPPPPPPPIKPAVLAPKLAINKDKVEIGDKTRITNGIRARADRPERLNELRQIALFYVQYRDTFNRPPATVQDFTEYIKRDSAALKRAIDEKYFVLIPNVRGTGIVAYERDPDQNGRHGVVTTAGAPDEMTTQDLVNAVKGLGN